MSGRVGPNRLGVKEQLYKSTICVDSKVLDIIQSQGAIATLIAPLWEGQFRYQRLQSMLIDQPIRLPTSPRTILAICPKAEP